MAVVQSAVSEADLLGADVAPFHTLLRLLLSPSNEQRGQAEAAFSALKERHPDAVALKLSASVQPAACPPEIRTTAAVLLRRVITKESVSLWPRLSPGAQAQVKADLLHALQGEGEKSIWKKLCDTTAELASGIVEGGAWPELLPFLLACLTAAPGTAGTPADELRLKEIALLILSDLVHFLQDQLRPLQPNLHSILAQCLAPTSPPDLRLAALRAAVNLVEALESQEEVAAFQDLLPGMMQVLSMALNTGDEASAQESLKLLLEVAELEPRFMRRQLVDVVSGMLGIAETSSLEDDTRHLAIEFLISLAEARERAAGMMRKVVPHLVPRLFQVLLMMLTDIDDVAEWHAADREEDEDAGETENYEVAQECLDRLSLALGGNTVLPVASQLLPAFASDTADWKKRHAALICLSQIAEGCSKLMLKSLEAVASLILGAFGDPSPRVRWAAINAVGQLSTDLGPQLQEQYHAQIMPALINAMDDNANPRVQAHATAAVLNFSEEATPEILGPYMDALISKLLVLMQHPRKIVQEGALTAIAGVADCAQEQFLKYYDAVMPYLKTILTQANRKEQRMLRAKAMECISLIGMAVGKDKFRADALQVMEVLVALQQQQQQQQQLAEGGESGPDSDDPTMSYMLQAWARLCRCLGQEFLPFMNIVMPPLMQSAALKPDVTIKDIDEDNPDDDDDDDGGLETITLGDKRIGIRTSMLEEKATACSMLCCYADELQEGFLPWIDEVSELMVPLLKFYFHGEVRKSAAQALPQLIKDGKLAVEKGLMPAVRTLPSGGQHGYVKGLVDFMVPHLVNVLPSEPEEEICVSMLESLKDCLEVAGREVDRSQVEGILKQLQAVQRNSAERREERAKRTESEDFDEEESEALEEENDLEDEILDGIGECLGALMRVFKADFDPFFGSMAPSVLGMLGKKRNCVERRVGICIFDDAAEHMGEAAWKYYGMFVPALLEATHDANCDIRQAAAYGLGVCAENGGAAFKPYANDAVARLGALVSSPEARSEDNVGSSDNAVSALGKLCEFQGEGAGFDTAQVLHAWLHYLPVRDDKTEAKSVHAHLARLLQRSDPRILGPSNNNLPRIAAILAEVLAAGTDLASEETVQQITHLLKSIPPEALAGVPPEHHALVQSVIQGQRES